MLDHYKEKELLLKERELNIKEWEAKAQLEINRRNTWFSSPLLVGLLSVIFGSLGTAYFQRDSNSELERQKFEYALISKALEGSDKNILTGANNNKEVVKKLSLLVKLGFIKNLDSNSINKLSEDPDSFPDYSNVNSDSHDIYCRIIDKFPTTVVKVNNRNLRSLIQWQRNNYPNNLSANEQCEMVSKRLKSSLHSYSFITYGIINKKNVVCATKSKGTACSYLLFEIPSSVDPKSVLRKFISPLEGEAILKL